MLATIFVVLILNSCGSQKSDPVGQLADSQSSVNPSSSTEVSQTPPQDLTSLEQQVAALVQASKFDKAIELYSKFEKDYAAKLDGPQDISFHDGFVKLYLNAGKVDEAEKKGEEALKEAERKYGTDSANARSAIVSLISVTDASGNKEKRDVLVDRFVVACEKNGNEHRLLKALTLWESSISYACGEPVNHARLEKLLQLRLKLYGPEHQRVLQSRLSIARNLSNSGKLEESAKELRELVKDTAAANVPGDFLIVVRNQYGKLLFKQGKDKEAEKIWKDSLPLLKPLVDVDPSLTYSQVEILSNLGFIYYRNNRFAQALPYYKSAVESLEHNGDYTGTNSDDMFAKYVSCLEQTGKKSEAEKFKAMIDSKRANLPKDSSS